MGQNPVFFMGHRDATLLGKVQEGIDAEVEAPKEQR